MRGPESPKPADLRRSIKACWRSGREVIHETASAPLVIVITDDSLRRLWTEHVARWCYYYDPARLEEISERLIRGRSLTSVQLEYLKDLKNLGDDLRYFFLLFSAVHQVSPLIQSLVKMAGQILAEEIPGAFAGFAWHYQGHQSGPRRSRKMNCIPSHDERRR